MQRNLIELRDDKTVLKNPHKGWYWHYYDNGVRRPLYRDRLTGDETYYEFPGLNHLYLRMDWQDIQPAPDVFDWSAIDTVMDTWGPLGYTFAFRVCCSETCEEQCFATPRWLYDMGCRGVFIPPTKEEDPAWWSTKFGDDSDAVFNRIVGRSYHRYWEPDYGDPLFLKYLDIFLAAFAARYDNDPRVEYVDIGSYGNWGEGHVCFGSRKSAPLSVLKQHAYLHVKHFRHTAVLMNDDFVTHMYDRPEQERQDLFLWCRSLGCGIRDDSIIAGPYESRAYHTIECPAMFDAMYTQAPVDVELGHYWSYNRDNARDGLVIIEAARRAHATFAGFHTYPEQWLADNYHVTEYLANRLGYWYTVNRVSHIDVAPVSAKALVELELENMGFAPAYHPYLLELKLSCGERSYIHTCTDFVCTELMGGQTKRVRALLQTPDIPGTYALSVRLREGERPLLLAMQQSLRDADGFYAISELCIR